MQFQPPSLTLVYLMYNEEENIQPVLDEGIAWAEANLDDWEILVVDDGSSDGSADRVREHMERDARVRMVQHPRNRGMGGAMKTGVLNAEKDYFVFLPSDGQVEAAELSKMVPLLIGTDIVLTVYERRADTLGRILMSRALRDYMLVTANIRFLLEGLYLYPTAVARELVPKIPADTFFFSFELVQRGLEEGLRYVITVITCKPRLSGSSKVTGYKRIARVGRDVLDYRLRRDRERRGR